MKEDLTEVPGVGPATAQKLLDAGVLTVPDLAMLSDKKIVKYTGFPLSRATAIRQNALEVAARRVESSELAPEPDSSTDDAEESRDRESKKHKTGKKGKHKKDKDKKKKKGKSKKKKKKGKKSKK